MYELDKIVQEIDDSYGMSFAIWINLYICLPVYLLTYSSKFAEESKKIVDKISAGPQTRV